MSNPYLERLEREAAARETIVRDLGEDVVEHMDPPPGYFYPLSGDMDLS